MKHVSLLFILTLFSTLVLGQAPTTQALKSKNQNQVFNCISTTRSSIDWIVKLIEEHSGKTVNKMRLSAE